MTNIGARSETVEFKEGKKQFDKGVKSLVAMLNSYRTGTVYFGVNEAGDVIGLDSCETAPDRILESFNAYVKPAIEPKIDIVESESIRYICVSATGSFPLYSFDDRYYIRKDMSNAIASPEELVELIRPKASDDRTDSDSTSDTRNTLSPNLIKVMKCLKKDNTVKLTDVSKKTGISLSSVKKYVTELKRLGYVDNKGTNRNSLWIVNVDL